GLPTSTAPHQGQFVPPGANVTFSVSASGKAPLSYQWRLNGKNLPGATLSTLTLTNVQSGGDYSVVVSNTVGLTISQEATLHVSNPPLEEALDTSALFWITYGQDLWCKQIGKTHDGEDAAQGGFASGG